MLTEVSGDILLSKAQVIAHGVAPNDHFDSGLALALRERWPAMVKDFRHYCRVSNPSSGTLWTWGGPGGVRIVSLLTQEPAPNKNAHPGQATSHNVGRALKALAAEIEKEGWTSVALPKLATGVGRMDWSEVKGLIDDHLGGVGCHLIVYSEYHAGVEAKEPVTQG